MYQAWHFSIDEQRKEVSDCSSGATEVAWGGHTGKDRRAPWKAGPAFRALRERNEHGGAGSADSGAGSESDGAADAGVGPRRAGGGAGSAEHSEVPQGLLLGWRHRSQPVRGGVERGRPWPERRRPLPRRFRRYPARDHHRYRLRSFLSQSRRHRLLPSLRGGYRALRRDGLYDVPHVHLVVPHLPERRRRRTQRGRPRVLRSRLRLLARARHRAARDAFPLRDALQPGRALQRLGEPRAHRHLRALLRHRVRALPGQGALLDYVQRDQLRHLRHGRALRDEHDPRLRGPCVRRGRDPAAVLPGAPPPVRGERPRGAPRPREVPAVQGRQHGLLHPLVPCHLRSGGRARQRPRDEPHELVLLRRAGARRLPLLCAALLARERHRAGYPARRPR